MRLLFVLFTTLSFFACNSYNKSNAFDPVKFWNIKDSSTNYYFIDTIIDNDTLLEKEASSFLYHIKEPIFYNYKGEGEFIRLTWIRAFENPIMTRFSVFKNKTYLTIKKGAKDAINTQGYLLDTTIVVQKKIGKGIVNQLLNSDYFSATYSTKDLGKDGATWFLEYKNPKFYKSIKRWDDAYLSSPELYKYAGDLIQLTNSIIPLKSSR